MIFSSFGNAPAEMSFIRMAHAIDEFAKESEEDVLCRLEILVMNLNMLGLLSF